MREIAEYLDTIKLKLITSPIIAEYYIVKERTTATDGYIRIRATLPNGDFLELTESFIRTTSQIVVVDYRYQWMDSTKAQLRQRWDNTPHHPEIPNFPHHVHLRSNDHVVAGQQIDICQLLDALETLIAEV